MSIFIDLTDQKFGQLTVLKRKKNDREGKARWHMLVPTAATGIILNIEKLTERMLN